MSEEFDEIYDMHEEVFGAVEAVRNRSITCRTTLCVLFPVFQMLS